MNWIKAAGFFVALSLGACSRHDDASQSSTSQIAAQVNDKEISIHQVQTMIELQPGVVQQWGPRASERVLDSLIEQELAAQAARSAGLDGSPKVVQAVELAKREVLARAYQDQLANKAEIPDDDAITRYYVDHPELFAQRRQYTLQEALIKAPAAQLQALKDKVTTLVNVAEVNTLVDKSGLPHSVRNSAQWAEALPMDVLSQLATRKMGQSVAVNRPDGLVILTVLSTESAPLNRAQAHAAIREALWSTYRKDQIKQGMASLRQQAKVQRFDGAASAVSSASSQPASAP